MDRNRYPRRTSPCRARVSSAGDNCLCATQKISYAMSYVKEQQMAELYPLREAWRNGTVFPELDLPYCAGGRR